MDCLQDREPLNIEKTALVVIDLQNGIVKRQRAPYTGEQVVAKAGRLVDSFTEKGAFVVLVRVSTHDGKDMLRPNTDSFCGGRHDGGYKGRPRLRMQSDFPPNQTGPYRRRSNRYVGVSP